ncbi:MAG: GPR endopeptidase [Lachnobacterium sp.]|nr:GPR endopeptidase [Lachnobacterium sp.]
MQLESYPIRTDLALESQERLKKDHRQVKGVRLEEEKKDNGVVISTVFIDTENAAKAMGRPRGTYVTIEAPEMIEEDAGYHRDISVELAKILRQMVSLHEKKVSDDLEEGMDVSVLIAGLGNREVTPDALGPKVVDHLFITRHIINEFGHYAFSDEKTSRISGIVPGVMAQTGMECVEILRGIIKETEPDFIITVDALAARNVKRLNRTIQLTDTGITPGSGIGNHRNALNQESLGIPVISLGVPTVVNAATIVADAMNDLIEAETGSNADLKNLDEHERQELARELLSPQLNGLFVTPKNIDDSIKQLSFLISEGLNIALLGNKDENANI